MAGSEPVGAPAGPAAPLPAARPGPHPDRDFLPPSAAPREEARDLPGSLPWAVVCVLLEVPECAAGGPQGRREPLEGDSPGGCPRPRPPLPGESAVPAPRPPSGSTGHPETTNRPPVSAGQSGGFCPWNPSPGLTAGHREEQLLAFVLMWELSSRPPLTRLGPGRHEFECWTFVPAPERGLPASEGHLCQPSRWGQGVTGERGLNPELPSGILY